MWIFTTLEGLYVMNPDGQKTSTEKPTSLLRFRALHESDLSRFFEHHE